MNVEIAKIFLTLEFQPEIEIDPANANTDVIVQLSTGEKYIASFFTFENVAWLRRTHRQSGLFLHGKYFWAPHMLLIDRCSREDIKLVVDDLLELGNFQQIFTRI